MRLREYIRLIYSVIRLIVFAPFIAVFTVLEHIINLHEKKLYLKSMKENR